MKKRYKYSLIAILVLIVLTAMFYFPMFMYQTYPKVNPYIIIGLSNFVSIFIIFNLFYLKYRFRGYKFISIFLLLTIITTSIYFSFTTDKANFKNLSEVEQYNEYTHPVIRYYTKLLTILDPSLVITDANREVEDYDTMGLPRLHTSKHIIQEDGYSHALDLRTNNRSDFYVFMIESYYKMLGFNTLIHNGTAMHLHVDI